MAFSLRRRISWLAWAHFSSWSHPYQARSCIQGHPHFSPNKVENNLIQPPNQIVHSIHIMIKLCYFSLDQWEIEIEGEVFYHSSLVEKPLHQCGNATQRFPNPRREKAWFGESLAVSDSESSLFKLAKYFCCLLCFPVQCLMAPCGLQKIAVNFIFWHIYIYVLEKKHHFHHPSLQPFGRRWSLQESDFIPRFSKICQKDSDNISPEFLHLYIVVSPYLSI